MRLRSSHFVFLMLLICSVQVGAEMAYQLRGNCGEGRVSQVAQHFDAGSVAAEHLGRLCLQLDRLSPALSLDPAAASAERIVWQMASPARASAATVSHTSLLRA